MALLRVAVAVLGVCGVTAFQPNTGMQMGLRSFAKNRISNMRRQSIAVPVETPVAAPFDLGAEPPFSLGDIRAAIPNSCFEKNTRRSMGFLAKDVGIVAALAAIAIKLNNPFVWPAYWLAQGTMFWALFVVGHDCGHGSFSNSKLLNNIVGHFTHASILVPYHGWRISHRTHHANHGNIDTDESWVPLPKKTVQELDLLGRFGRFNPLVMLVAYPFYLFLRSPGKSGSHFNPKSDLFLPSEKNEVLTSTASCVAMLAILAGVGAKFGLAFLAKTYLIPYVLNVAWLDAVTYLHHTEAGVPWYRGEAWNYMRGGISTRDRDYGPIINGVHHDIGTHVVHHLFPQMPHYHICEATEAIKPVLGEYYVEPEKSGILPFHLIKQYFKATRECIFVEDEGDVVYYKGKNDADDLPMIPTFGNSKSE
ncbi:unnamed protein product [Chrysoparadoxa australica]